MEDPRKLKFCRKSIGLSGLTFKDMAKYPAIIPMYMLGIMGLIMAPGYVLRMAMKHPETSFRLGPSRCEEPWQEYHCKQYKFLSAGRDYSTCSAAPKYK